MGIKNSVIFTQQPLRRFCTYRLIFGISYSFLIPVIPLFFDSLGMTTVAIGLFLSLYGVGKTLAQLPFGVITDAIGDKITLLGALVLMTFIPVGYNLTNIGEMAGWLYVLQGAILGMAAPATYSILARSVDPKRRGESTGLAAAVFTFGGAIGAAIGGYLVSQFSNYKLVFYFSSLGIGFTLVYVIFFIHQTTAKKKSKMTSHVKTKREPRLGQMIHEIRTYKLGYKILILGSVAFLGDFIYGCVVALFHFYGQDVLGATTGYTSAIISIYLLVFGVGAPIAGFVADKIGNRRQLFLSFCVMNVSLLGLGILRDLTIFTVVIILYFLGATFLNAALQSSLSEFGENPKIKGLVFGIVGASESLGYAVGPIISAAVYEYNKTWLFFSLIIVSTIISFIFVLFRKKANI